MTNTRYYDSYLDAKVQSASPLQLIYLAYECAIEVIGEAREHLREGRIHERSNAITRVMKILTELDHALDHSRGGDMSKGLADLYLYMQDRLREANFRQIDEPLAEVEHLLETLASAWREIAEKDTVSETANNITGTPIEVPQMTWAEPAEPLSYASRAYSL
jgi:flagellar protein FliS